MSDVTPGWYKDPVDPDVRRYWDGEGWLGEPIPVDGPTPPPPAAPVPPPSPAPSAPMVPLQPGTPLPTGAVVLPPGIPVPPGGFPPGQLPPGAIVLPPGTPLPPGLLPHGQLPAGAVQVLLPPQLAALGQPAVRPHGYAIAGLGTRLVARLIDIVVVLLLNAVVTGWFVYQWLRETYPAIRTAMDNVRLGQSAPAPEPTQRATSLEIVILVLIAAVWFAYEVPAIAAGGQTLGKRLMKIKVMRLDTEDPVGFGRAIRRWNPLGLSTLLWTCGLGFLLQFAISLSPAFDWPLRRAFHDRSAGTVVVQLEDRMEHRLETHPPRP